MSAENRPFLEAKPCCIRFTIAPYCALISPQACVQAIPTASSIPSVLRPRSFEDAAAAAAGPNIAPECHPLERTSPPWRPRPMRGPSSYPISAAKRNCESVGGVSAC